MLRVDAVTVRHHANLPPVLDGMSCDIVGGAVTGVVGANGSGKSTLARVIAGIQRPDRGRVVTQVGRAPRVGLVLQDPAAQLIAGTVADDVAFGPECQGMRPRQICERVASTLAGTALTALALRTPQRLSGGQQQRVATAGIVACSLDVVVFDEATSQLDAGAADDILALTGELARAGLAVVWLTQRASELEICNRVLCLAEGRIAFAGAVSGLLDDDRLLAACALALPPAARIARELRTRGLWPQSAPLPAGHDTLAATLCGDGG